MRKPSEEDFRCAAEFAEDATPFDCTAPTPCHQCAAERVLQYVLAERKLLRAYYESQRGTGSEVEIWQRWRRATVAVQDFDCEHGGAP